METKSIAERNIFKNIKRLEIRTRHLVDTLFNGDYMSLFKGRGLEFVSLKEYEDGDNIGDIDWSVTARLDEPYIKTYREERELPVMLVIDGSPSMQCGIDSKRKWDAVLEVSATLIFSAVRSNSRIGLLIFTDKIELFIPPAKGNGHAFRILKGLLEYRRPSHSHPPLIPPLVRGETEGLKGGCGGIIPLQYLHRAIKKRFIVFFISDFIFPLNKRDWFGSAKRYDLIAVRVLDQDELQFPDIGLADIIDAETGEYLSFDSGDKGFKEEYARAASDRERETHDFFNRLKIDDVLIRTDRPLTAPFLRLFYKRARQGLSFRT